MATVLHRPALILSLLWQALALPLHALALARMALLVSRLQHEETLGLALEVRRFDELVNQTQRLEHHLEQALVQAETASARRLILLGYKQSLVGLEQQARAKLPIDRVDAPAAA